MRNDWYRIDVAAPSTWTWTAYPTPRSRFDSAGGGFRVRYAAQEARAAMRERFDDQRRRLRPADLDLVLVRLTGAVRVLDLRREATLDALGLDDQISTSRAPDVWAGCQLLVDRVRGWFGPRCDGLVYRSRTTPERSANLAFFEAAPLTPASLGALRDQGTLIDSCILTDGFDVRGWR
ncbi:MAG: RES family NAD+ phosphorylase [Actinobacteria bacterium]|nr:RES family NAD+ phosphorylase [Actinomycetota bacterium]